MRRRKDFISIDQLNRKEMESIIHDSHEFYREILANSSYRHQILKGKIVLAMFFENSTRTRISFEIAAKRLQADFVQFDADHSSINKGESILDTLENCDSMGINYMVIRHADDQFHNRYTQNLSASIINAGDGSHEHPSQALLDLSTLLYRFENLEGKTIAIVGDIKHSRVANSNIKTYLKFGAQLLLCGPDSFCPESLSGKNVQITRDIREVLEKADVINMLRIQFERQNDEQLVDKNEYRKRFGLDMQKMQLAKKNSILMHPGPINIGLELDMESATHKNSVILDQVKHGVAVRMAIFKYLESLKS